MHPPNKSNANNSNSMMSSPSLGLNNNNNNNNQKKKKPRIEGCCNVFASHETVGKFPMAITLKEADALPRTQFELGMMGIAGAIRDKPEWWNKIGDVEIVNKWKDEVCLSHTNGLLQRALEDVDGEKEADPKARYDRGTVYGYTNEELYPEEDEALTGFDMESEEGMAQLSKDTEIELEELCYDILKLQADENGYLVANPHFTKKDDGEYGEDIQDEECDHEEDGDGDDDDDFYKLKLSLFDYALKECQWMAETFSARPSRPAAVQGVYCRDDMEASLQKALLAGIRGLRARPAIGHTKEDRHPGIPVMVDLVHPSLYCYEKGKTPVLVGVGAEALQSPPFDEFIHCETELEDKKSDADDRDGSHHFFVSKQGLQWLPSEFRVDGETNQCQINSYINNLHPLQDKQLYEELGRLFVHCLPLLEDCLNDPVCREPPLRIQPCLSVTPFVPEFEPYEKDRDTHKAFKNDDDEDSQTTPSTISLKNRPLQVIVKIASMELDAALSSIGEKNANADSSVFRGGTWHVEGCLDERIVATACCYLETENVQGGDLQFRIAVKSPRPNYDDEEYNAVEAIWGIQQGSLLVQPRGACSTTYPERRVLAWSNVWQHKVDAVNLLDPTQPGKRTIVCFFLVDPSLRVRSTATVPPQQKAWLHPSEQQSILAENTTDLFAAKVASAVSATGMTYEMAAERRDRLMKERSDLQETEIAQNGEYVYNLGFSLCEH
eukprot:scaffold936_cov106-Amphora_coffeaeformis.AAC.19